MKQQTQRSIIFIVLIFVIWLFFTLPLPYTEDTPPRSPPSNNSEGNKNYCSKSISTHIVSPTYQYEDVCETKEASNESTHNLWTPELQGHAAHVVERLRTSNDPLLQAVSLMVGDPAARNSSAWVEETNAVARKATLSSDAAFYSLAVKACRQLPEAADQSGCEQLSVEQSLRLKSNNALMWLDASSRAHFRGDRVTELDALYRASVAQDHEPLAKTGAQRLLAAIPSDVPDWARYALVERWMLDHGLTGQSGLRAAFDRIIACEKGNLANSNTRELCESLARNLAEHASNSDAIWSAVVVGENLDWSQERLAPLRRKAYLAQMAQSSAPTLAEATCGEAAQGLTMLRALIGPDSSRALLSENIQKATQARIERRNEALDRAEVEKATDPENAESNKEEVISTSSQ